MRLAAEFPWLYALLIGFFIGLMFFLLHRSHLSFLSLLKDREKNIISAKARRAVFMRAFLVFLAATSFILALMAPQVFVSKNPTETVVSRVIFALDVSKSMSAEDIVPSRFERSLLEIKSLAGHLRGNLLSLVVFSGSAFVQCPFTADLSAFKTFLESASVDMLPKGGTNFNALLSLLKEKKAKTKQPMTVVLFSDGESHEAGWEAAIKDQEDLVIHVIGLGSRMGEPLPVGANQGYLKDKSGKTVMSNQNTDALKKISSLTGGVYVNLQSDPGGIEKIYKLVKKLQRERFKQKNMDIYEDLGHVLGLFLFLLFVFFLFIDGDLYFPLKRKKHEI